MKPTATRVMKTPFVVLSLLYLFTMGLFAQAEPLRVAVMPSFTQNQTYGNAEIGKPVAVWGRAWGGTAPYSYNILVAIIPMPHRAVRR